MLCKTPSRGSHDFHRNTGVLTLGAMVREEPQGSVGSVGSVRKSEPDFNCIGQLMSIVKEVCHEFFAQEKSRKIQSSAMQPIKLWQLGWLSCCHSLEDLNLHGLLEIMHPDAPRCTHGTP